MDYFSDSIDTVSKYLRAKRAYTIAAYCYVLEKGGETLGLTPITTGVGGENTIIGFKIGDKQYFLPDAKSKIINMDALYGDPELIV
jgi:hypothetical protein